MHGMNTETCSSSVGRCAVMSEPGGVERNTSDHMPGAGNSTSATVRKVIFSTVPLAVWPSRAPSSARLPGNGPGSGQPWACSLAGRAVTHGRGPAPDVTTQQRSRFAWRKHADTAPTTKVEDAPTRRMTSEDDERLAPPGYTLYRPSGLDETKRFPDDT